MNVRSFSRRQQGLSYLEVLIAAAIIAVSIVPVATGLRHTFDVATQNREAAERHFLLIEKIEEVLSYSYDDLVAEADPMVPTRFSDDSNSDPRRLVYIFEADGDNEDLDDQLDTGVDADLLLVRAEYVDGSHRFEVLKSRP